jgi:sulfate transport system substrate-binding protein
MKLISIAALVAAALVVAAAPVGARPLDTKLDLVAYSTPGPAYAELIPAFQKTAAGKDVSFSQSYGASGEQTRAVLAGQQADFVHLSLWPDMSNLVQNGLVDRTWGSNRYQGILTRSVVVFVLRDGNPKKIRTWNDLVKPGVEVLTPNPFTSGGAKWNIVAAYGSQLKQGKTKKQAEAFVRTLFHHVSVQDSSARNSLKTFLSGKGDVLLTYENEAILAQKQGQKLQYVIPKATLRIDNPAAVTKGAPPQATAWLKWLYTAPAQKVFASWGYRPVVKSAAQGFNFPSRPDLFTIGWLGGWAKVDPYWFDPKKGLMVSIEREVGGSAG